VYVSECLHVHIFAGTLLVAAELTAMFVGIVSGIASDGIGRRVVYRCMCVCVCVCVSACVCGYFEWRRLGWDWSSCRV